MQPGAPAVLVCAAAGTGLTTVLARLAGGSREIIDLESSICQTYVGDERLALEPDEVPNMERVARRPRTELQGRWRETVSRDVQRIKKRKPGNSGVLGMHLSWYNSDSNEFFFPVEVEPLRKGQFSKVVVLIDDIYDMYTRLQGDGDLYSPEVLLKISKQLRKLGFQGKLTKQELRLMQLQLKLEATEHALDHLLLWRRAEMTQAENLALSLGAELTLLGTKHSADALRAIVDSKNAPRIYLSHRITEVRGMNKKGASLPDRLGVWAPVASEVNRLHLAFANSGQVLVNPTAIDELRFGGAKSRTTFSPFLASRWPLLTPIESLLWSPLTDHQHTQLLLPEGLPADDPIASSVARSLASRIFFEIAFRDHYIVEHTPNLLVYRPFFCEDYNNPESVDWSGGVKPEIRHWLRLTTTEISFNRAAFVHTRSEIIARLRWLERDERYQGLFVRHVREHLKAKLKEQMIPSDQIDLLLSGKIQDPTSTHLAMNPQDFIQDRATSIDTWIRSYGLAALHEVFSMLERPHQTKEHPGNFDVALMVREEDNDRTAKDLNDLIASLTDFFAGEGKIDGAKLSEPFWSVVSQSFVDVFGISTDDAAFAAIGITAETLASLQKAKKAKR
jgi:hypothetical protein